MGLGWGARTGMVLSAAGLAAWLGYRSGYEGHRTSGPAEPPETVRTSQRAGAATERTRDPRKVLEALNGGGTAGPPSHQALADSWALVRTMTVAEIRAVLGDGSRDALPLPALNQEQFSMLFYRWGQLDPLAAVAAQKESEIPPRTSDLGSAAVAWMTRDPEAAFQWAKDHGMNRNFLGYAMAQILTAEDPSRALSKAAADGDEVLRATLNTLGRRMSATAEDRQAFVALLAASPPEQRVKALSNMAMSWGAKHPDEALAGIGQLPGLAEGEAKTMRKQVLEAWRIRDPAACAEATLRPGSPLPQEEQIDAKP